MLRNMIKIIFGLLIMVAAWSGFRDMMFMPQREPIWVVGQVFFVLSLLIFIGMESLSRNRFTLKAVSNGSIFALAAVPVDIGGLIWVTEEPEWIVAWAFGGMIFLMLVYSIRLQWLVEGYKILLRVLFQR